MKKITLCIASLLAGYVLHAQDCSTGATLPYSLDFESAIVPAFPDCTTAINAGSGNNWTTATNPGSGFTTKALQYTADTDAANAWFFTKGIQLNPGVFYKITYKYGNNSATTTEKLRVHIATSPTVAGVTGTVAEHGAITGGTAVNFTSGIITVTAPGTYYLGFNAYSDASQGTLYVDNITMQDWDCGMPSAINFTNLTPTSATASWTAAAEGTSFGYIYGYSTTNAVPADANTMYVGNGGVTAALSNLEPGTTYYFFIRSQCGPLFGDWSAGIPFTTPCLPTTVPYTQNFEITTAPALPVCVSAYAGNNGNNWVTAANPGNGFTTTALSYSNNANAANAWFFTQGITLTAGSYYKVKYKYGNNSATTTEKLRSVLATSPDAASTVSTIFEHTAITGGTAAEYSSGIVTVPTTGTYYIGFNAYSDAAQGSLYVDDIELVDWSCGDIQDVAVGDITQTTATLTWSATGENTTFNYFYWLSTSSEVPGGGPQIPATATSFDFTDLQPGTTYYVFMRNQCGPLMSGWTTPPVSFTTLPCTVATVPYTQDFESVTAPAIPTCNAVIETTGNNWATAATPGNGFTSNALQYTQGEDAADAWYFTQGVQLTAGAFYKVSYKYGNDSTTTTEKLKVTVSTEATAASANGTTPLGNHTVTGGTLASNEINYFNVPTTGTYYFGFNAYSDAAQGNLYVDDFSIVENICGEPVNVAVADITDTTATLSWEVPSTGNTQLTNYEYAYGTTDTPPASGTGLSELTIDLTELTPSTTYYVFTRTQCGPVWSDWVATEFTTDDISGTNDYAFKSLAVYPNPVKNSVTINNTTTIDTIEMYNITGQLVYSQTVGAQEIQVNIERFAAGAYLLNISANGATKKVKVIKQ